jgi:hypothetical protein
MKNISEQIVREIAKNKDWTKKYSVRLSLVKNPRTPISSAMGMVSLLNPRDMKALSLDKNVSEAIRKTAQRFVKGPEDKRPGGKH